MHSRATSGRIIHCASYGGPYEGSFVPMLAEASRAAARAGYETTLCFTPPARGRPWLSTLEPVAEVTFLQASTVPGRLRELATLLRRQAGAPTVLHTHFGAFDTAAALAGLRPRTAVVWHWHSANDRPIRWRSRAYGAVFGRIVDTTICVSPAILDGALQRGYPRRTLRMVPNAIDTGRFGPISEAERAQARRQLGIDPGARVVLHFAWHWHIKGGDRLLATAAELAADPALRFLTVVGEDARDAPREEIARRANVSAVAPRNDVETLFAAADVFLNCSRSEGMPYAVLEALSRGLPVVATDLPVQREVLDGLPGARVVAPDPARIAGAVREVLGFDASQRDAHAVAARARMIESYGLGPWAERLVDLYSELLDGRRRS